MPKLGTRMLPGSDSRRLRGPLGTTSTPQALTLPFEIFFEVLGDGTSDCACGARTPSGLRQNQTWSKAIARFSAKLVPKL
jgi:hypothetical protein